MLVVGLYDGNIAVYNLQKNVGVPNYQSDAKNGKHRDIVWQVGSNGLITIGQCCMLWTMDIGHHIDFLKYSIYRFLGSF